ncbi:FG-GAP repeat protein [Vibrio mimicus]
MLFQFRKFSLTTTLLVCLVVLAGCDDDSDTVTLVPFNLHTISVENKQLKLSWDESASGDGVVYTICEKDLQQPNECNVLAKTSELEKSFAVNTLLRTIESQYFVMATHDEQLVRSNELLLEPHELTKLITYIKASNTDAEDNFGSIALSANGNTLAVGAVYEDSLSTGINGDDSDNSGLEVGAVYVYRFDDGVWSQQAYVKASNTGTDDRFGRSVALSSDGNTLAVGAEDEDSSSTGINGLDSDNSAENSGAVYVYRFDGAWSQQAYVKASNTGAHEHFGSSVALSSDGNTLAVGAVYENSSSTGINGVESDDSAVKSGAVYVYRFDSGWSQQAYVKASNTNTEDRFGRRVALSSDGNTLAVGAENEDSSSTGINGVESDNASESSGAVYVYRFDGDWSQQAYVKASNTDAQDLFGHSVALSMDGNTLAVAAVGEDSPSPNINGGESINASESSGAAYVYRFDGGWSQQAYVKASNTDAEDLYGESIALSMDGNTLAVSAVGEDSSSHGINGYGSDNSAEKSGAAYVYRFDGDWSQQAYVKASNTGTHEHFGSSVALSSDGNTLAVGAENEDSSSTGINGDDLDNSAVSAGAVYVY